VGLNIIGSIQRDFPEKRLSEFRSLRKSKKIRRSEAIRRLVERALAERWG
jgi:hypothetical protein